MHQQWQRFLHLLCNSLPHSHAWHPVRKLLAASSTTTMKTTLYHSQLIKLSKPCSPNSSQSTNLLLPFIFTNQFTLIKQMKLSNITLDYNENNMQGGSCSGLPFLPQYNQSNIKIILQNFHGDLMKQTQNP